MQTGFGAPAPSGHQSAGSEKGSSSEREQGQAAATMRGQAHLWAQGGAAAPGSDHATYGWAWGKPGEPEPSVRTAQGAGDGFEGLGDAGGRMIPPRS